MSENGIVVVCPTYNCKDYINRTMSTILSQKSKPEEVIFSDDGSQDNTVEIIEKNRELFTKAGIELKILNNLHEGPGAARNHGIFSTSLPWIAFLDADDTWKTDKIKRVKQLINDDCGANCFLHWEDYIRSDGSVSTLENGKEYEQTFSISKQLYRNNFLSTSAVVCNRFLLMEVGGFDKTLPNCQDYDLWLKISPMIKIKIILKY